jgi:UDP-N-acetylmuramate--alanine ligase
MTNSVDFSGRPFHFIGIGGIGMSALAYVLAKREFPVSGSDLRSNHITLKLESIGAHIFGKQEASNLEFFHPQVLANALVLNSPENLPADTKSKLPQVICSTAINTNNLEYKAALELGCPVLHRSDVLAALIAEYYSIAVAGTHGKTTTSSMIGYMLLEAGLDPTILVGGEVNAWEGNARLGQR